MIWETLKGSHIYVLNPKLLSSDPLVDETIRVRILPLKDCISNVGKHDLITTMITRWVTIYGFTLYTTLWHILSDLSFTR